MIIFLVLILIILILFMKFGVLIGLSEFQTYILFFLSIILIQQIFSRNKKVEEEKESEEKQKGSLWWDFVNLINLPLIFIIFMMIVIATIS